MYLSVQENAIKKITLIIILIFSVNILCAFDNGIPDFDFSYRPLPPPPENPHSINFRGRRLPGEDNGPAEFKLIGVKISEIENDIVFHMIFTKEVNPSSINLESFLINGKELEEVRVLFSKTSRGVQFIVPKRYFPVSSTEPFTINIQKITSFDNQPLPKEELNGATINTFFKFLRKEKQWIKY